MMMLVSYFVLGTVGVLDISSFSDFFADNSFCCEDEF